MPGGTDGIKGISISVTADASQVKSVFEKAVQGLENKTVVMKVSVSRDKSITALLSELRNPIPLSVTLSPTKATLVDFRRNFKTQMGPKGVPVPITVQKITTAEATTFRNDLVAKIGAPTIFVNLVPIWPDGTTMPPPPGGWGGGTPGAAGRGGGTRGGAPGAGQPVKEAVTPEAPVTAAGGGTHSSRYTAFVRRENEAQQQWMDRVVQEKLWFLNRLNNPTTDRMRSTAQTALNNIDRAIASGGAPPRTRSGATAAPSGRTTTWAGSNPGWQPSDAGKGPFTRQGNEDVAHQVYQNFIRRPLSRPLYVGGEFPQVGMDPSVGGRIRDPRSGRLLSEKDFQENRGTGTRLQRTGRGFYGVGPYHRNAGVGEGRTELTPAEIDERRLSNLERIGIGKDAAPGDVLAQLLKTLPSFGPAYEAGMGKLAEGDLPGALGRRATEGHAGSGLRGALSDLLARGRAGQIPGVTNRVVTHIVDPKKGLQGGGPQRAAYIDRRGKGIAAETDEEYAARGVAELQQADFELNVGVLQDIISGVETAQRDRTENAKKKRPRSHRKKILAQAATASDPLREEAQKAEAEVAALESSLTMLGSRGSEATGISRGEIEAKLVAAKQRSREIADRRHAALNPVAAAPEAPTTAAGAARTGPAAEAAAPTEKVARRIAAINRSREKAQQKTLDDYAATINRPSADEAAALASLAPAPSLPIRGKVFQPFRVRGAGAGAAPPTGPTVVAAGAGEPQPLFPGGPPKGPLEELLGGGGGIHVIVDNWPAALEQGLQAASPISDADMRRFAQMATESPEAATAAATAPKGKGKKAAAVVGVPKLGKAALRESLAYGLKQKYLTQDEVAAIQERGASRTAQEALHELNPQPGGPSASFEEGIAALEQRMAESRQGLPIRSPAVSIAQKFAGPQRGKVTARLQQAGKLKTEAQAIQREEVIPLIDLLESQSKQLDTINAKQATGAKLTAAERRDRTRITEEHTRSGQQLTGIVAKQSTLLEQANKAAGLTGVEQAENLARSFAGNIVGTIGYGAALGAIAGAGLLASKALGPVIERSLGYQNVTAALTNSLAEQQQQQGGNVKMLVAQQIATTHMSKANGDLIKTQLEMRTTSEAGARAIQSQTELLAAGGNITGSDVISQTGVGRAPGVSRYSSNPYLYESKGGVFDTSLFAPQQSGQEAVAHRLDLIGQESPRPLQNLGYGPQVAFPTGNETAFKAFQNDVKDMDVKAAGAATSLSVVSDRGADLDKTFNALVAADMKDLAAAVKINGVAFKGLTGDVTKDAIAVTMLTDKLMKAAALGNVDSILESQKDQIRGIYAQNAAARQNQLDIFLPAQRAMASLQQPQAPFGRSLLPQQNILPIGVSQLARGRFNRSEADLGAVGGGVTGLNGRFAGVPPEVTATFNTYRDVAQKAIDTVNAKAAEGEAVLRDRLHIPQSSINQMRAFGQALDTIAQKQANLQLDLQYTQFNHQLYLAKRNLGDIAGLTGRTGAFNISAPTYTDALEQRAGVGAPQTAQVTQIGYLQRQDLLLSRKSQMLGFQTQQLSLQTSALQQQSAEIGHQSQALSLQLSQRQINFQRAVAGFSAPGVTPEERAARLEEAKVEGDYAQRQLDFQKQQFAIETQTLAANRQQLVFQREAYALSKAQYDNQVALQDALNNQSFQDQRDSLAELVKTFTTGLSIQALSDLAAAEKAAQDTFTQDIAAQIQSEQELIGQITSFTVQLETTVGKYTTTIVNKVKTMFEQIRASAPWFFGAGGTGGAALPSWQTTSNSGQHASGVLGQTFGPTQMMVGEAGRETVAVLRNPRPVPVGYPSGGGSGGGSASFYTYITVSGNTVRDDRDLDMLAAKLTRMVGAQIARQASGFGLRVTR